jgi:hypothetical protein
MGEDSSPGQSRIVTSMFSHFHSPAGRDAPRLNVCESCLLPTVPRMPGCMGEREAHDVASRALPRRRSIQADALFVSGLQRCDEPSAGQARQAVAAAIRAFGRSGCAGRVAEEFGEHPETAVIRMRWARAVAGEVFAGSVSEPGMRRLM